MAAVGFEPTPPKRLVPKTSALDHSATLPSHLILGWAIREAHTAGKVALNGKSRLNWHQHDKSMTHKQAGGLKTATKVQDSNR